MWDTLYVHVQVSFRNESRPLSCFVGHPVYCVCTMCCTNTGLQWNKIWKVLKINKDHDDNCNDDDNNDIGYGNYNNFISTKI